MTAMNIKATAQTPRSAANASRMLNAAPLGSFEPNHSRTVAMYMKTARMPGTMPAMNSVPMSCSVM